MKRLGQELGWVVVVAAVFLLPGFTGCTATIEGAPPARPDDERPVVEKTITEDVTVLEVAATEKVDPALAAYTASAGDSPMPAIDSPVTPAIETPVVPVVDDGPLEATLRVHEIALGERDGDQTITLVLSRTPDGLRHFSVDRPSRLVIDLKGPIAHTGKLVTYEIGSADLARIRIGEHPDKLRVVADLAGALPSDYSVEQEGRVVVLVLPVDGEPLSNETIFRAPGVLPAALRRPVVAVGEPEIEVAVAVAPEIDSEGGESTVDGGEAASDVDTIAEGGEAVTDDEEMAAEGGEAETDDDTIVEGGEAVAELDETVAQVDEKVVADAPPSVATDAEVIAATDPVPDVPASPDLSEDELTEIAGLSPIDHVYEISADTVTETEEEDSNVDLLDAAIADVASETSPEPALDEEPSSGPDTVAAVREPTYVLPMRDAGEYTGQRISLDFKDADIQNVLRILADVSDLNIITTEDVGGRLTIRLMDVPWDQALYSILKAQGLDMVRDGNIVRISTVEKLKEEREAQRAADEAQKQAEPLRVRYMHVNYAKADEGLVKKVQEVLTERGTSTWDERTNTIVVRDIARGIASAEELITEFDTQTPQVLIEANIVEATESFARDLGVQWGYTYSSGPEIGNSTGTNFPGRVKSGGILAGGENSPASTVPFIADFPANIKPGSGSAYDLLLGSLDGAHSLDVRLTALERQGKGKVISRPRVVTLNNVMAKIESLEILRVKLPSTGTVISTGAGGAAGAAQSATEQIRTGITLEVTPQVSSDGYIFLDVYVKSSALQDPTQSRAPSPDGIPNEVSREAESHVLIKDGETFVLGGVFRNVIDANDTGLPFLSSIPVIGWAFRNQFDIDNRQELLVFVTPRVVRARGTENVASLPSAESLWHNRESP